MMQWCECGHSFERHVKPDDFELYGVVCLDCIGLIDPCHRYRPRSIRLLTFNLDAIGPPQANAICSRCGKQNRWALEVYLSDADHRGERHRIIIWPDSVMRCYHCRELFSPQWHAENWEPDAWWRPGDRGWLGTGEENEPRVWSE